MSEISSLSAQIKLLDAQQLLLRIGEAEVSARLQPAIDRLAGKLPTNAVTDDFPTGLCGRARIDLDVALASVAETVDALSPKDAFMLADIEARLADEVRRLVLGMTEFVSRAQLICKEIPDSAHFTKLVTSAFLLISLQLAYAFQKGLDKPIFFDDGAKYLEELGLSLGEFAREIELDGRRFVAIAFDDKKFAKLDSATDGGDKC